jgi:hypothetical protein
MKSVELRNVQLTENLIIDLNKLDERSFDLSQEMWKQSFLSVYRVYSVSTDNILI